MLGPSSLNSSPTKKQEELRTVNHFQLHFQLQTFRKFYNRDCQKYPTLVSIASFLLELYQKQSEVPPTDSLSCNGL